MEEWEEGGSKGKEGEKQRAIKLVHAAKLATC